MFNPESRERGTEFEHDLFGQVDVRSAAFKRAMTELGADQRGYLKYRQAMELAEKFQPADPRNPKKEFSRDLRLEVADLLEIPYDDVAVYTALKTPLDIFHGVDGFLKAKIGDKTFTVTMDASLRDKPPDEVKADLLINRLPDPNLQEDAYLESLDGHATVVAGLLKAQAQQDADQRNWKTPAPPQTRKTG